MPLPDIETPSGRRAWAFAAIVGGSMVFTVFAAVGVYLVRNSAGLSFWLALAAHGQVAIGLLSIGGLLIKRHVTATKDGISYEDKGEATVTAEAKIEVKDA